MRFVVFGSAHWYLIQNSWGLKKGASNLTVKKRALRRVNQLVPKAKTFLEPRRTRLRHTHLKPHRLRRFFRCISNGRNLLALRLKSTHLLHLNLRVRPKRLISNLRLTKIFRSPKRTRGK